MRLKFIKSTYLNVNSITQGGMPITWDYSFLTLYKQFNGHLNTLPYDKNVINTSVSSPKTKSHNI